MQIGFQSLGSRALPAISELVARGEIGDIQGISATGRWVRDRAYYKRSAWAGKRSIDGIDVVDGVSTNPLAHAVATALRIAGAHCVEDVASVETDLYRANDIESDDTSVIRIRTAAGLPITCALTLCAGESVEPYVTVQGSRGQAVFHYTEDRLVVTTSGGSTGGVSDGTTSRRTCSATSRMMLRSSAPWTGAGRSCGCLRQSVPLSFQRSLTAPTWSGPVRVMQPML